MSLKKSISIQKANEQFKTQINKMLKDCHVCLHEFPKWTFYNIDDSFATASFKYDSVKQRIAYKMIREFLS